MQIKNNNLVNKRILKLFLKEQWKILAAIKQTHIKEDQQLIKATCPALKPHFKSSILHCFSVVFISWCCWFKGMVSCGQNQSPKFFPSNYHLSWIRGRQFYVFPMGLKVLCNKAAIYIASATFAVQTFWLGTRAFVIGPIQPGDGSFSFTAALWDEANENWPSCCCAIYYIRRMTDLLTAGAGGAACWKQR